MEYGPKIFPQESTPQVYHTLRHNQFEVDVFKLIHLTKELPESSVNIVDYLSSLDEECWSDDSGLKITPREVAEVYKNSDSVESAIVAHPNLSQHLRQLQHADYSFPILVFESKIVDGKHRLVKAFAEGQSSLKAKIISKIPEDAIIKLHENEDE